MAILRFVRKLFPQTFEGWVALATFVLLAVAYAGVLWFRSLRHTDVALSHATTWTRIVLETTLVFVVPIALYIALRSKATFVLGEFPDIDKAWSAGLKGLSVAGIPIESLPLFVIAGLDSHETEQALASAALADCKVNDVPGETGVRFPLKFYATVDAIYVFLSDLNLEVTAQLINYDASTTDSQSEAATLLDSKPMRSESAQVGPRVGYARQMRRIAYVGRLIRSTRFPWCGANGMIFFLPYRLLMDPRGQNALQSIVKSSVDVLTASLGLQMPISVAVSGMEELTGFATFVNCLRETRQVEVTHRRLGRGFDLTRIPLKDSLGTERKSGSSEEDFPALNLTNEVFHNIEDRVYDIFQDPRVLQQSRSNRKLYEFLVRSRFELRPRLAQFLRNTFGVESDFRRRYAPAFFSGCYLTTIQPTPSFLKGLVVDKLLDEQAKVQWMRDSKIRNRILKAAAVVGWMTVLILLLVLLNLLLTPAVTPSVEPAVAGFKTSIQILNRA